jgi:flagellar motor switch protein FliN
MSEEIELPDLTPADGAEPPGGDLERLESVSVEVAVEIGRTRMTLGGALALAPGSIVTLDRAADQPVDLLVNGRPIARGEVVVVDEEFGLRVTEIIRPTAPQAAGDALPALPPGDAA